METSLYVLEQLVQSVQLLGMVGLDKEILSFLSTVSVLRTFLIRLPWKRSLGSMGT